MKCKKCGAYLDPGSAFCGNCGMSHLPQKKGRSPWKIIFGILGILLMIIVIREAILHVPGMMPSNIDAQKASQKSQKILDQMDFSDYGNLTEEKLDDQISKDIKKLIKPYLNHDKEIPYEDAQLLTDSSNYVYSYSQKMVEQGLYSDSTLSESGTVAFFGADGEVTLYIPPVEGTCSGPTGNFNSMSVDTLGAIDYSVITTISHMLSWFSKYKYRGAKAAAKLIYKEMSSCSGYIKKNNQSFSSIEDLINFFSTLNQQNAQVIFWRGHGNYYELNDGNHTKVAVWSTNVSYSKKLKEGTHREDFDETRLLHTTGLSQKCVITTRFLDQYMAQVNGGLFVSESCETGRDDAGASKVFLDKGFDAYVGPNGSVFTLYGDRYLGRLAEYLCGHVDGTCYNIKDAMDATGNDIGQSDHKGVSFVGYMDREDIAAENYFTLANAVSANNSNNNSIGGGFFSNLFGKGDQDNDFGNGTDQFIVVIKQPWKAIFSRKITMVVYYMKPYSDVELADMESRLSSSVLVESVEMKECSNGYLKKMDAGKIPHYSQAYQVEEPESISSLDECWKWLSYYFNKLLEFLFKDNTFYVNDLNELYSCFE